METNMITSKYFNVGHVVTTYTINDLMMADKPFKEEVFACLEKFVNKDWGILSEEDKQVNESALQYPDDLYLLGAYQTSAGEIYIITNRATSVPEENITTICFPDER